MGARGRNQAGPDKGAETMRTVDMGNNETNSIGITATNGGFLALTLSASKTFKTYAGAVKWLASRGYNANGSRL
jgi:hypothetical protein